MTEEKDNKSNGYADWRKKMNDNLIAVGPIIGSGLIYGESGLLYGALTVITLILSAAIVNAGITVVIAVNIFNIVLGICAVGFIAYIIYKNGKTSSNFRIQRFKESFLSKIMKLGLPFANRETAERAVDEAEKEVTSANPDTLNTFMGRLDNLFTSIIPFLTPDTNRPDSTRMSKSLTINGILYTSLINPTSNSIDRFLLNIKTAGYGIMDSLNDVDDMFARIKVGKELPKENTSYFNQKILLNKKERAKSTSKSGGGRSMNKKKGRRSKRGKTLYSNTRKMKRKKYI